MKTLKRCLMLMLVVLMLLSLAAPAFAVEVEPYGVVRRCSKCMTGTVSMYESRSYEGETRSNCEHGKEGYDVYAIYEVTIRESCDTCDYSSVSKNNERVFQRCEGH